MAPATATAHVLVLDIGKTNAKAALVDTVALAEIEVLSTPNSPRPGPPYPHADTESLWRFFLEAAGALHARHRVDAIVPTTHGATAALVDADGGLALPVLDYEHDGPDELAAAYDAVRPDFAESGSPRLPAGLNLGAQLFWQARSFPDAFARTAAILPYPQYWSYRLTGLATSEVTSLGTHTDLWNPYTRHLSSLARQQGWQAKMPPLRRAADQLGPIRAEVAAAASLDPATPVFCGIHDSNASLLPHLRARTAPFAVVSTGTWVISMAVGGHSVDLDATRDTLVNVDADGDAVPSARFMGGREWALATGGRATAARPEDAEAVVGRRIMLLPAIEAGSGPFPGRASSWTVPESTLSDGERAVAVSYYLALMTAACLELVGAEGPALIEGPFAGNAHYCEMLGAAIGRPVLLPSRGGIGTSIGAALVTCPAPREALADAMPELRPDPSRRNRMADYARHWRRRC